jgi:hypothetical protein
VGCIFHDAVPIEINGTIGVYYGNYWLHTVASNASLLFTQTSGLLDVNIKSLAILEFPSSNTTSSLKFSFNTNGQTGFICKVELVRKLTSHHRSGTKELPLYCGVFCFITVDMQFISRLLCVYALLLTPVWNSGLQHRIPCKSWLVIYPALETWAR